MTKTIDASPTKEFFIDMLTRDIALDRSLLDLIDNSVDAARENNIENAWIKIYFKDG
ncbi:ATP-binding protein, partial [Salmonella enterica]|nr:ATP-binding protein [Salmonella enterica]